MSVRAFRCSKLTLFEAGAGDFPAKQGGFPVLEPSLRVLRIVEDGQLSDFVVVAAEEDRDYILLGEDENEVFSGFSEDFHIA